MTVNGDKKTGGFQWAFEILIGVLILTLVSAILISVILHIDNTRADRSIEEQPVTTTHETAEQALADAQQALKEADETRDTLELLLSFLQGGAILAGVALGAAAYFGFRNSKETREELEKRISDQLDKVPAEVDKAAKSQLGGYEKQIKDGLAATSSTLTDEFKKEQKKFFAIVDDLFEAAQELQLKNYAQAHAAALRVLSGQDDNPQALYIAGWLELQFIPNQFEKGLEHLKKVAEFRNDWPTARAAYGIALRRQATKETDPIEQQNLFVRAEGELLAALGQNPYLLDPNQESFWGPIGGIRRDKGNMSGAIEAYENALKVTPRSSYPLGNLAGLYLEAVTTDSSYLPRVLPAFENTLDAAVQESILNPNDYFHVMDIAMSSIMLGQGDAASFRRGQHALDSALKMGSATSETLCRSLDAGWRRLIKFCPAEWTEVRKNLEEAEGKMVKAIQERGGTC